MRAFPIGVMCGRPEYIQNAVIQNGGNYVGNRRTVVCDKGFWIDQENNVAQTTITCSVDTARWSPEEVKCRGIRGTALWNLTKRSIHQSGPMISYTLPRHIRELL